MVTPQQTFFFHEVLFVWESVYLAKVMDNGGIEITGEDNLKAYFSTNNPMHKDYYLRHFKHLDLEV